jgi:hypothetical protein
MHTYILWIALMAYALHIIEEYTFNWKKWASDILKLPLGYDHFAVTNGAVIVLGVACAQVGWNCSAFALSMPALMLINATFMHVFPFLKTKGRFSAGLITSILLFWPIGAWSYMGAYDDGVLNARVIVLSFVFGALLLAFPIISLKIRFLPFFRQE